MELILYVPGDPPANRIVAAGAAGEVPLIASLLQQGVPIDAQHTHYKQTALHAAADAGHLPAVGYLIDQGADLNALDNIEMTPLMHACSRGRSTVALRLMAAGANVEHERSDDQMTALKFALWGRCSRTVIRQLLAQGAKRPEAGFPIVHLSSEEPRFNPPIRLLFLSLLLITIVVSVVFILKHVDEMGL
ncbi:ankyrin repeat domain-containing protein [Variovorax sp. YR566]|jgi:hypothetical protein|uniref:ankyrin repeat domain-containing protein n=1 Tax=Variovorax sp. YR566 TaxID=3450237 RepID=UPI003F7DA51B